MTQQYPRNPKATLWLCAYQGVPVNTVAYLFEEKATWPNLTIRFKGGDANIDRARSKVASWFLQEPEETAGDVLLMLDHDNAGRPGDLARIAKRALEHNAVVGGIYPKRAFGAGVALRLAEDATGTYEIGDDSLIPAEFVGTGFIAIPRTVLAALATTLPLAKGDFWPFFMPYMVPDPFGALEYPTDDWAFCARVREAGFGVYASTFPRLTHEGSYVFRMADSDIQPPADRDVTLNLMVREVAHA
jgi:hypothetical protein